MNQRIEQLERRVTDLQAAIEILATAVHENPKPLTHIEPLDQAQAAALAYAVSQLRNIGGDSQNGGNGELHEVVEYYMHEVKRS